MKTGHPLQTLSAVLLCVSMISGFLIMAPSAASAAPNDAWIEGTITDGASPIANVYVLFMPVISGGNVMGAGWTDSSGYYNVTVIGGLAYIVMAFHGGYWGVNASVSTNPGQTSVQNFIMTS